MLVSPSALKKIIVIVVRYVELHNESCVPNGAAPMDQDVRLSVIKDLELAYAHNPLDLTALLECSDEHLKSDISGIVEHLNRDTGDLGGYKPNCWSEEAKYGGY